MSPQAGMRVRPGEKIYDIILGSNTMFSRFIKDRRHDRRRAEDRRQRESSRLVRSVPPSVQKTTYLGVSSVG